MKKIITGIAIIATFLTACNGNKVNYDASGTFEVDEVIVSAELTGKLLSFDVREGDSIAKDKPVGTIDAENLSLQKDQVQASIEALREKTSDLSPQVKLLQDQLAVQQSQLDRLTRE